MIKLIKNQNKQNPEPLQDFCVLSSLVIPRFGAKFPLISLHWLRIKSHKEASKSIWTAESVFGVTVEMTAFCLYCPSVCRILTEQLMLEGTLRGCLAQPFEGRAAQKRSFSILSNHALKTSSDGDFTVSLGRLSSEWLCWFLWYLEIWNLSSCNWYLLLLVLSLNPLVKSDPPSSL